jgi:hypothetical protein
MLDDEYTQSQVGYQNSPKEYNEKRGMPTSQFKGDKMPQDSKIIRRRPYSASSNNSYRYKENR